HPTDAQRVFRTAGCYAGRNVNAALEQSTDQGATWRVVLRPPTAFPERLVGGQGNDPARFYLTATHDFRAGGASVFRSDDGGGAPPAGTGGGGAVGASCRRPNLSFAGAQNSAGPYTTAWARSAAGWNAGVVLTSPPGFWTCEGMKLSAKLPVSRPPSSVNIF